MWVGGCVWSLFCGVVLVSFRVLFNFKSVVMYCGSLCFMSLPRDASDWSVIVAFPGHTHLFLWGVWRFFLLY